jgi:hypothetical protein
MNNCSFHSDRDIFTYAYTEGGNEIGICEECYSDLVIGFLMEVRGGGLDKSGAEKEFQEST